ncbi:MAG: sodium:proton antiporter NhaD [Bacteroidales bacterium]
MEILMLILFIVGYIVIALEQPLRVNKSAVSLLTGMSLWVIYALGGVDKVNSELLNSLGQASEVLFFLVGAMLIVEFIDQHGGFELITSRIDVSSKRRLLWVVGITTFFLSSMLDNMSTTIVMVMLLRKLIDEQRLRWLFVGVVVVAANAGGAWTPIGDVTSILLWVNGNLEALPMMGNLFLPSFLSLVVPLFIVSRYVNGNLVGSGEVTISTNEKGEIPTAGRVLILVLGVMGIIMVPIFNELTTLPPFMGILLSLSLMWIASEIYYNRRVDLKESAKRRMGDLIHRIDFGTILFLLGILLSVGALSVSGVLSDISSYLDRELHSVYGVNVLIGLLSSVVDNSSLVAGAIGMYPIVSQGALEMGRDPVYMSNFLQNGDFWLLLNYCAGTGGSIFVIGSAAGVVAMGLDKITFVWYMKRITPIALLGFVVGVLVFYLQGII